MVLGVKTDISDDLYLKYQRSGLLLHIMVASGGNIAIMASVLIIIFNYNLNRKTSIIVTFIFILFYLFLSGLEPPLMGKYYGRPDMDYRFIEKKNF